MRSSGAGNAETTVISALLRPELPDERELGRGSLLIWTIAALIEHLEGPVRTNPYGIQEEQVW